jgi:hypothetical protein
MGEISFQQNIFLKTIVNVKGRIFYQKECTLMSINLFFIFYNIILEMGNLLKKWLAMKNLKKLEHLFCYGEYDTNTCL